MRISGHKTRTVFERYNIVSPDDLKRAAVKHQVYREEKFATTAKTATIDERGAGTDKMVRLESQK